MRALITTDDSCVGVALVDRPPPEPSAGEVAIDVAYAGVCRTDLAVIDGTIETRRGLVIGHELAGRIVDSGEPVAVVPFSSCGACSGCRSNRRCTDLRWLGVERDGAFADRVCVPASSIVSVPRDMSLELAAYVEPVAAALGALPAIARGDRVLVSGEGRIAELCARVIETTGTVVVRSADRSANDDTFDVVVETAGGDLTSLLSALRPGGTLVLKSRARRQHAIPAGLVVARDLAIRGASHGSFEAAIDWLHARRIAVDDLLAPPRPLEAFGVVIEAARASESKKQLFRIEAR